MVFRPSPLKNDGVSSSVGMMFHSHMESHKSHVNQTTNQIDIVTSRKKKCCHLRRSYLNVFSVGGIAQKVGWENSKTSLRWISHLVGGWPTPLKNDGVRQWEGWHPIYELENKSHVNQTTKQVFFSWKIYLHLAYVWCKCRSIFHGWSIGVWLMGFVNRLITEGHHLQGISAKNMIFQDSIVFI